MTPMKTLSILPISLCLLGGQAFASPAPSETKANHVWGDFDGDEFPDLLICGKTTAGQLLLNQGDGSFRDVTSEVGLESTIPWVEASWCDFDGDLDLDLLLLTGTAPAKLYRNVSGIFQEVTSEAGLVHNGADLSAEWTDFNRDDLADLVVSQGERTLLYHNLGRGRFELIETFKSSSSPLASQIENPLEATVSSIANEGLVSSSVTEQTEVDQTRESQNYEVTTLESDSSALRKPVIPASVLGHPPTINPVPIESFRRHLLALQCAQTLHDINGPGCLEASSDPLNGKLYPLGLNLFVNPTGDVGMGTFFPQADLHIAGDSGTGTLLLAPGGAPNATTSRITFEDGTSSSSGFELINTANGMGRAFKIRSEGAFSDPFVSILGGVGHFGLNIDAPEYRFHSYDASGQPQVVADGGPSVGMIRIHADDDKSGGFDQARLAFDQGLQQVARIGFWDGIDELIVENEKSGARLELKNSGEIHIENGGGDAVFVANGRTQSAQMIIRADTGNSNENSQPSLVLQQDGGIVEGRVGFFGGTNDLSLSNEYGGSNLNLTGDGKVNSYNELGVKTFELDANSKNIVDQDQGAALRLFSHEGDERVTIETVGLFGISGRLTVRDSSGSIAMQMNGGTGVTSTKLLTITGGADVAEPFDINGEDVIPGMIVAIDSEHAGSLRLTNQAYDRSVAGVVSGAGGINTGLMLSQTGSLADGEQPVALSGRVYCWANTSNGEIKPGDLLTTSNVAGHAMKATDSSRAFGSVIGKAMTALDSGTGLVLVLVNLQ